MNDWEPKKYLSFAEERTRPSQDLVNRIELAGPHTIYDLGCGPGNGAQVLRKRWRLAQITGVDSSPAMIDEARMDFPGESWEVADIGDWEPDAPADLIFSNATFQWLPDHAALVSRLFSFVAPQGAFAFQIPGTDYSPIRGLMIEVAQEGPWANKIDEDLVSLTKTECALYYDTLCEKASRIDMWETTYMHVLESSDAVIDWIASTGLRPFMAALDTAEERKRFVAELRKKTANAYRTHPDGKVLMPFKRLFVIAYA